MKDSVLLIPETFFPKCEDPFDRRIPVWLFTLSIIILFAITHFAVDMLPGVSSAPQSGSLAQNVTRFEYAYIAAKGIAFRISVIILAIPVIAAFYRFLRSLERRQLQKALLISSLVFIILGVLCFPYSDGGGLRSMGVDYGAISSNPFAVRSGFFYRRLLQPGVANVLGFGGMNLYYLFTLVITFLLVFITTLAIQRLLSHDSSGTIDQSIGADIWMGMVVLSAATTSYVIFHFQFPGYPEQLGYIFLLLMAFVPMSSRTRWSAVALGLASHEIMIFALVPVIVFCFQSYRERIVALAIVGLYGLLWLSAYRFHFLGLVRVHTDLAPAVNTIDIFMAEIRWVFLGALSAHKLLWATLVWAAISLIRRKQFYLALGLISIALAPLATLVVAADTSRLAGLGFLGILLAIAILHNTSQSIWERNALRCLLTVNILAPSVYISANYHRIPCPGLYELMINRFALF